MYRWVMLLLLLVATPAAATELRGRLEQGGLVLGHAAPGASITLDDRPVPTDAAGRFILGFGRDAAAQAILSIDGVAQSLTIAPRTWKIQRINGLPPSKVTPDTELQARIGAENRLIAAKRAHSLPRALFLTGLVAPAEGIVSGVFGSQRILNGEARAPHSGTDIAASSGTAVKTIGDGIVTMAHSDLFFTGQTVMIDHGLGLQSVYAHLSRTDVSEGESVSKGQIIGAVGASGRATGPHLHWGTSWQDVRLDPETVMAVLSTPPP